MLARRIVVLSLAALPLGCRRAVAGEPGGWRAARWGMSSAALDTAFGTTIRRVDPPMAFGRLVADRLVPGVHVAGRRFIAFLQHAPERDALAQVLLQFYSSRPAPEDFAAVRQALIAELGPPRQRSADIGDSADMPSFATTVRWRAAGTEVTLRYVDPNAEPYSGVRKSLTVRYTPAA